MSSARELMPSFESVAQVVLGGARADEHACADVAVREPVAGQPCDVELLLIAGRAQLARSAFGEGVHAAARQHLVRGPELLAGIDAAVPAAHHLP
jgi:hypothetical protein